MSIWSSVIEPLATRAYQDSGHIPVRSEPRDGPLIDLATVPVHLSRGVWVRLYVGDTVAVLDRRGVTALADALQRLLQPDPPPDLRREREAFADILRILRAGIWASDGHMAEVRARIANLCAQRDVSLDD